MVKKRSRPLIPTEYLWAVSDRICSVIPTREITYNTLKAVWSDGAGKMYLRRIEDSKYFKDRQEQHFTEYWNGLKDFIDDVIHGKVEPKQSK